MKNRVDEWRFDTSPKATSVIIGWKDRLCTDSSTSDREIELNLVSCASEHMLYQPRDIRHNLAFFFFFANVCTLQLKFLFPALLPLSELFIRCYLEWQDVFLLCIESLFVLLENTPKTKTRFWIHIINLEVHKEIKSIRGLLLIMALCHSIVIGLNLLKDVSSVPLFLHCFVDVLKRVPG